MSDDETVTIPKKVFREILDRLDRVQKILRGEKVE